MNSVLAIIISAQNQNGDGTSFEAVIQVITIAGAAIGLISAFVQYLQTRIRPKSDSNLAALRLRTASSNNQKASSTSEAPAFWFIGALMLSAATFLSVYLLISEHDLIFVIGIIEFGFLPS